MRSLLLLLVLGIVACGQVPPNDDATSDDDDATSNDDDATSDDDDAASDDDDSAASSACPVAEKLESFPWPYTSACSSLVLWNSDGFGPGLAVSIPLPPWPDSDPDPVGTSVTVDLSDPDEAWRASLVDPQPWWACTDVDEPPQLEMVAVSGTATATVTEHVDGVPFRATIAITGVTVVDVDDPQSLCAIPDAEWADRLVQPPDF